MKSQKDRNYHRIIIYLGKKSMTITLKEKEYFEVDFCRLDIAIRKLLKELHYEVKE